MIELKLFQDIQAAYDSITEADLDRINRALDPPDDDETPLGVVHSMEARRIWAVAHHFAGRTGELLIKMKFYNTSEADKAELTAEASRWAGLSELARDIFWATTKDDLNGWTAKMVGIRQGWMLVQTKSKSSALLEALGLGDFLKGQM